MAKKILTNHVPVIASRCIPKFSRLEILLHSIRLEDVAFKIPHRWDGEISAALTQLREIYVDNLTSSVFTYLSHIYILFYLPCLPY